MVDLLVPLYRLSPLESPSGGPRIRRAMAYERQEVVKFVADNFHSRWASEVELTFSSHPIACHVAIEEGRLCGFSCYDATFRGFFGPMAVSPSHRGSGTGRRLLAAALAAMQHAGYAYAIIGDVHEALEFYRKCVDARVVANSDPGAYEYDLQAMATHKNSDA